MACEYCDLIDCLKDEIRKLRLHESVKYQVIDMLTKYEAGEVEAREVVDKLFELLGPDRVAQVITRCVRRS